MVFLNNNTRLKLEVINLSGKLLHKYGNLLKKVPLNKSVLTLLIVNRWVHTRPSSALQVHLSSSVLVTYLKCT